MKATVYLHGSRDNMFETGKKLGLQGEALSKFSHACTEVKLELDVHEDGAADIAHVDGRALEPKTESDPEPRLTTGLLDKNLKRLYTGDVIRVGMRRGDDTGWTEGRIELTTNINGWSPFQLVDVKTGERQDMQLDQELREFVR